MPELDLLRGNEYVEVARQAWAEGDINLARTWYQKAAYGYQQLTPEQNAQLRAETAAFAQEDPIYKAVVNAIRDHLADVPGALQSDIGKLLGDDREMFNYALYFAEVCGDLVRVKSGRSYRLYLPGQDEA